MLWSTPYSRCLGQNTSRRQNKEVYATSCLQGAGTDRLHALRLDNHAVVLGVAVHHLDLKVLAPALDCEQLLGNRLPRGNRLPLGNRITTPWRNRCYGTRRLEPQPLKNGVNISLLINESIELPPWSQVRRLCPRYIYGAFVPVIYTAPLSPHRCETCFAQALWGTTKAPCRTP